MTRNDHDRRGRGRDASTNARVGRRDVLRGASAAGVGLAGLGVGSGAVAAQDGGDGEDDANLLTQCTGGDRWPEPPEDFPTVSFKGHLRPSYMHDFGEVEGDFPEGADEIVVFVHGWLASATDQPREGGYELERALAEAGHEVPVVSAIWSSHSPNWWGADERADVAAERLADWLAEYLVDYPDTTIRLVGHSLGGHVALRTLSELDGRETLASVAILGAAVDADSVCEGGRYAEGIAEGAAEVYNFHSEDDDIVCSIYPVGEFGDDGIGCGGSECHGSTPENFEDVDVTGQVGDHCAYMLSGGHGCVEDIVERFSDAELDSGEETDDGENGSDGDDSDEGSWFGGFFGGFF